MSMTRKDYGTDAIVPDSTELMKSVKQVNSPYSVQALGYSLTRDRMDSLVLPATRTELGSLDRVLQGNSIGYVVSNAVTTNVITALVVGIVKPGQLATVNKTLTDAQIVSQSEFFVQA